MRKRLEKPMAAKENGTLISGDAIPHNEGEKTF
jgi:hypothetical protein